MNNNTSSAYASGITSSTPRNSSVSTLRIQPVAPARPTSEEIGHDIGVAVGYALLHIPLSAWFLMLAMGTLHELWPVVPAVGFWQAVTLILGLSVLLGRFSRPWRWAQR